MEYLSLPLIPEPRVSQSEAMKLTGVYKARNSGRIFTVAFEDGELTITLFLTVRTRLVWQAERVFLAEGWHFEVQFEATEGSSVIGMLRIGGRDVEYLLLADTVADKIIT